MSTENYEKKITLSRMPAMFIGHGNPMNAITDNPYRDAWLVLGKTLPKPQAILCISAHWQTRGTQVCIAENPPTIHDFGGFPKELFAQQYPAPGSPKFAKMLCDLFEVGTITPTQDWGLDHGAWSVLQSLFPEADVPVFQLSLDVNLDFSDHFALARKFASLREQGVMVIASGNIVHNLPRLMQSEINVGWAYAFDDYIKTALENGDDEALIDIGRAGECAKLAVPSDEHYLPLLYIAAIRQADDNMRFLTDTFDFASLSMRSVIYD